ncbi:anthranilate phosphoribosyltransferase [Teredinibacter sp. KSP-S5-2]|uniref:anthranilate phosphoribosyltransferase n=1 Tax=Teredinibacter sp. KSP-S5-2 TaxID=3034506 RepID=UPI002934784E|nr:anthranilate phosphoribosyltransferase [Teredinibacter sp. KSP-S5-2]WNO08584.1 anthranilate phosphoribosyltransferase [Teredinibacter sp. KSP-S5-2]
MSIREAIAAVINRQDLSEEDMISVMRAIMSGEATDAQIGGFLVALRMKGETIDEVVGAARVMRELAAKVNVSADNLIDTCGTGGDGASLFNVSTASAFVVAAAGGKVAKHGNRSVSSSTGSADVLEAAGVNLSVSSDVVARAIETLGVGFMFAPAHHGAMKYAIGPRKELGQRTIFNMLGPLTNPAGVKRQVLGVFDKKLCKPLAEVLGRLGSEHVMVVHSEDGLDELSVAAPACIAELKDGVVSEYSIEPAEFGHGYDDLSGLAVSTAEESLNLIRDALSGKGDETTRKAASIIALNAGAAIYVSGIASDFKEGVALAEDAIASGLAKEKIKELVEFTNI